jgi:hypothetical protein
MSQSVQITNVPFLTLSFIIKHKRGVSYTWNLDYTKFRSTNKLQRKL